MANFFNPPPPHQAPYQPSSNTPNLQFYPSSYPSHPVSGHSTPSQAFGGYGGGVGGGGIGGSASNPYPSMGGFLAGPHPGAVSGRMGEQGGLRTGWLAAFGTEGYEGEPPLLEELGVNFRHIKGKVRLLLFCFSGGFEENREGLGLANCCLYEWWLRRSRF